LFREINSCPLNLNIAVRTQIRFIAAPAYLRWN
jgi:hypothetical protein